MKNIFSGSETFQKNLLVITIKLRFYWIKYLLGSSVDDHSNCFTDLISMQLVAL